VWGRVQDGDWEIIPLEQGETWRMLEARYVEGKSWKEISQAVKTPEKWDALYERIRKDGFLSQRELANQGVRNDADDNQYDGFTRDCEIGVAIDRGGTFVWCGRGSHRINMAKLLEVDQIPVQVRVRHAEWQAIRDEIRETDSIEESPTSRAQLTHEDMADLK